MALARGMEVKHLAFDTGCSGAKVVCNVGPKLQVTGLDKKALLHRLSGTLNSLGGTMYTGCDLNSTLEDMQYLSKISPYFLAAIGNKFVEHNCATAHGEDALRLISVS